MWGKNEMKYKNDEEKTASKIYSNIKSRTKQITKLNWTRKKFIGWYISQDKNCSYCECKLEEIQKFYKITKKQNKRPKRGNSLEVDRKDDKPYSEKNCCLACYWCNNAKTDVFKVDEFKIIGKAIGKIIRKRIK